MPGRGDGRQDAPLTGRSCKGIPWDDVALLYAHSDLTLRALAELLGITTNMLFRHSMQDGWVRKRKAFRREMLAVVRKEQEAKLLSRQRKMLEQAETVQERGLNTGAAILGLQQQRLGALVRRLEAAPHQAAKDAILAEVPDLIGAYRALRTAQEARIWSAETEGKPSVHERRDVLTLSIDEILGGAPTAEKADCAVLGDEADGRVD